MGGVETDQTLTKTEVGGVKQKASFLFVGMIQPRIIKQFE